MIAALLLKGFVVGIVIAVPVGPVGVLCIRRTILEGRVAGLSSGTGAATADAMFAVIAGFGLTALSDWLFGYQDWLRVGGAAFLFYVGISAFMHDPAKPRTPQQAPDSLLANGASTFALTITNPVTILSFLAIFAGLGLTGREMTMAGVATLVFGVWLGSLSWWVALAVGAGLFRHQFTRSHLVWINRGSGGILVLCGIGLIGSLFVEHCC
jgi:threonine/homoserine/homoserine lactone efflux protein